jgi:hypothetical protein
MPHSAVEWRYELPQADQFFSWRRQEQSPVSLAQDVEEPSAPKRETQLFPFAGAVQAGGASAIYCWSLLLNSCFPSELPAIWTKGVLLKTNLAVRRRHPLGSQTCST